MGRDLGARVAWSALSLALLVGLWALAASLADTRLVPGPGRVWAAFLAAAEGGALAHHVGATLARVLGSFLISILIGGAIGLALGRAPAADRLFDPWLVLFLNLPALVVIILCYVWFGLNEVAAIAASNPNLETEFHERGGHVGFVSGRSPLSPRYYAEERVLSFLASRLDRR